MPALKPWCSAVNWKEIDQKLDPVQYDVPILLNDGIKIKSTVVALLHPARSSGNQRY